jgi:hypothetical protein
MGGDVVTLAGASVQVNTLPRTCTMFQIRANGGDVYYTVNGAAASANSPGYIAMNSGAIEGPLQGLLRLDVFGAAGAIAHITFYKEKRPD